MKLDAKGNYIPGPATMYQHLRCTNDNNGNPRRVFVFYDAAGGIVAVEDEGYRGTPAACRGLSSSRASRRIRPRAGSC